MAVSVWVALTPAITLAPPRPRLLVLPYIAPPTPVPTSGRGYPRGIR